MKIQVSGVDGELRTNVDAALSIPEGLFDQGRVNRLWLRRYISQVPDKVRSSLEPFGYYQVEVTTDLKQREEDDYLLEVTIGPGPATYLETVQLELSGEGRDEKALLQQVRDFPLRQGDILRHDRYEQGKGRLEGVAIDLGYIKAKFIQSGVEVSIAGNRARIYLVLDTGPQYKFGQIDFYPPTDYPKRFLSRYLTIQSGQVFSYAALGRTQAQLLDSDRFSNVTVSPLVDAADEYRIPVRILLQTRPRRSLRPGIGYGTDTGARFSLLYRDVNVWKIGHRFETNLVVAEVRQSLATTYILPHYRNVNSFTAVKTGYDREKTDTYSSRKLFTEGSLVNSLSSGSILALYARLQREDYEIGDTDEISQLLIPGIRWSHRTYVSPTRPKRGHRLGLEVRGTRQDLLSDISLLQVMGDANILIPLPAELSLFLRGNAAATIQQDEFAAIPVSLRFFAGGDQSVRGFAYQTLGPVDASGQVVGGKHLLVGSVELEKALGNNWGVATFYDTGNAFNNLSDYELARAAGIGLRWYTLVGPIKIDVARQLSESDPEYRLHVSVGFAW